MSTEVGVPKSVESTAVEIGTVCPSCGTMDGGGKCGNNFHASMGFGPEGSAQRKDEHRQVSPGPSALSFRTIRTL